MRWIIWYLRSLFCTHTWEVVEQDYKTWRKPNIKEAVMVPEIKKYGERDITLVSATCTKCGWHRSYSKFGT